MGGMLGGGGGGGGGSSAPDYGKGAPGVGYTNLRDSVGPAYTPQYAPQSATPFLQSIMAQHGTPLSQGNSLGLPSLQSMFGMQQQSAPYQSGLQQLAPLAPYVGSNYRPDTSKIMANLRNVAPMYFPSVASDDGGGGDGGVYDGGGGDGGVGDGPGDGAGDGGGDGGGGGDGD